jgi:hypothetical protein
MDSCNSISWAVLRAARAAQATRGQVVTALAAQR